MELAASLKLSVSELVKRGVLDLAAIRDEVYERGYREGYYSAVKEVWNLCDRFGPYTLFNIEEFTVPCFKCGKPVVLSSRNKEFWERGSNRYLSKCSSTTCTKSAQKAANQQPFSSYESARGYSKIVFLKPLRAVC
jgi:hypothetical protein